MKNKSAFAVFTKNGSGEDYMVKGNFGNDEAKAQQWIKDNDIILPVLHGDPQRTEPMYPNGLFVKEVKY